MTLRNLSMPTIEMRDRQKLSRKSSSDPKVDGEDSRRNRGGVHADSDAGDDSRDDKLDSSLLSGHAGYRNNRSQTDDDRTLMSRVACESYGRLVASIGAYDLHHSSPSQIISDQKRRNRSH